ncbi:GlxA family transcriptional regulator [Shimia sp. SDUM112013]|uniref:GlxA family transcriptional regulator n=1 Tax=Shimia sp. SDUM112013 TaxID=3136160 RepID=UPI0032ED5D94
MVSATNIFQHSDRALNTAVLVLDDCNTLSFAAAVDPMRATNRRAGKTLFRWQFFTANGSPAKLTSGLSITAPPLSEAHGVDFLIVVAGFNLERHSTPALLSSLRRLHRTGASIAAIDGGPWILARAGLLDNQTATTHWEDLEEFATRFPQVTTLRDRFVISPPFATSGGAAPGIDMMLHLIAIRFGDNLARRVASAFLYDPVPLGTQGQSISATSRKIRRNPRIAPALELMEAHLEDTLSIQEVAARMGLSQRSLEQRFRTHLNQSPHAWYLQLRLDEAYRLATDTSQPVQTIAMATGFSSQASFARAFRKAFGHSVREIRAG